jgi:uncharacterized protein YaaN involved in tellurite resistance
LNEAPKPVATAAAIPVPASVAARLETPADVAALPAELQARVREIASRIDISDSQAIVQYGVGAQAKISGFADSILSEVRAKDSGAVGEILTGLVLKIKDLDAGGIGTKGGIIKSMAGAVRRFLARYEKLSVQIEKIVDELERSRIGLLRDITLLDTLYGRNLDYLRELDLFIAAGIVKLVDLRDHDLPALEAATAGGADPVAAQRLADFRQFVDRLEKKVHDLRLSRMVSLQTAPQIRLIQNADQLLVEKIQSSLLATIPLWKNQVVIALSIFRQRKALEAQKEVTKATNELLSRNAEMLHAGATEVARESERGIVEIDTLKKVNEELIATIEETLRIQQDGREQRAAAEGELVRLEAELKERLTARATRA